MHLAAKRLENERALESSENEACHANPHGDGHSGNQRKPPEQFSFSDGSRCESITDHNPLDFLGL